jgi:PAS domain S-box-containing protein
MDLSSGHSESEQRQISLAYLPPTARQTRSALVGAAILLLGLAALAPFAGKPLPQVNVFIPALDAIIFVTDLITASLFLAHFSITRSRALLALSCGYLFLALIVVAHGLTFPGVFPPTVDLTRTARINFMIYLVWHLGLPAALFAYLWLRDKDGTTRSSRTPTVLVAISSVAGVFTLVGCIVWLAAAGDKLLPSPLSTFQPFPGGVTPWLVNLTMLICAAALFVLWAFRRSVLDQWLMVVVLASMVELAITGRLGWHEHSHGFASRFTLGFYTGRVLFSLLTSTVVLIALLTETSKLYAGVARANTLASAVNASQALSSEIELPHLIERLMTIALQNSGADRGLLILPHENDYRIEAEALADGKDFALRSNASVDRAFPETIVRYATRTQESVILDDAAMPNLFSEDPYLGLRQPRSVLCLPLVRQGMLGGLLYLEKTLAAHVFTPERTRLLELLASQAAISLENATLYSDLQLQVGLLQHLPVSAWTLKPDGTPDFVNRVWLEFAGQTLDFVRSHPEAWMTAVHPEDREMAAKTFWEGVHAGQGFTFETRSLRAKDGTYRRHLQQAVVLRDSQGKVLKFVGTTTDIDDQKRTEEVLRQAQGDLARINRVTTMGELAASLAHEIIQPITGAMTGANVCVRSLGRDNPDLDMVREAVTGIAKDTQRAAEIIGRIRSQFQKGALGQQILDVNEIIAETVALLCDEAVRYRVSVRSELGDALPQIVGDRVQLQQVMMNLIVNSIEAMKGVDGIREIIIQSQRAGNEQILVSVSDTGIGLPPELAEQIFDPFFTTKPHGTGMGLRISRSIVESHGGRLWAVGCPERGATFHLNLPTADSRSSINEALRGLQQSSRG